MHDSYVQEEEERGRRRHVIDFLSRSFRERFLGVLSCEFSRKLKLRRAFGIRLAFSEV